MIFTRAAKGNITMNKSHYSEKMEEILNDKMTYTLVNKNPILTIERNLNNLLKR